MHTHRKQDNRTIGGRGPLVGYQLGVIALSSSDRILMVDVVYLKAMINYFVQYNDFERCIGVNTDGAVQRKTKYCKLLQCKTRSKRD